MSHIQVLSKNKFKEIIDSSVDKVMFQNFIELISHAQTCPQCSKYYNGALAFAENHLKEKHR